MDGIVFLSGILTGELQDDFGTARMLGEEICDLKFLSSG
jgi:hypothetical protein